MRREFVAVVLIVGVLAAFTATAADLAVTMNLVSEQGVGKATEAAPGQDG